jgi:hypothetical protein
MGVYAAARTSQKVPVEEVAISHHTRSCCYLPEHTAPRPSNLDTRIPLKFKLNPSKPRIDMSSPTGGRRSSVSSDSVPPERFNGGPDAFPRDQFATVPDGSPIRMNTPATVSIPLASTSSASQGAMVIEAPTDSRAAVSTREVYIRRDFPFAGTPGALLFTGANATRFCALFERMGKDSGLPKEELLNRVWEYSDNAHRGVVETLATDATNWDAFVIELKKQYRTADIEQSKKTPQYLEAFLEQQAQSPTDTRAFCLQFHSITAGLVSSGFLTEKLRILKFLGSLPEAFARSLSRKIAARYDPVEDCPWAKMFEQAMANLNAEQTFNDSRLVGRQKANMKKYIEQHQPYILEDISEKT